MVVKVATFRSDKVENTCGTAVNACWFCWSRCTSCCVSYDCAMCVTLHGGRPMLCGIMLGMDQKDSFYVHKPVAIPQVQFLDKVICPSLCFWSDCGDSQVALLGQGRADFLSWCRGRFPWSRLFVGPMRFPLLLDKVIDVLVVQVVQLPRCSLDVQ